MQIGEPALAPSISPFGSKHHEIEGIGALHLDPIGAAPPGFVRSVERLRHDTLMAARESLLEKSRCFRAIRRDYARNDSCAGQRAFERAKTLAGGAVSQHFVVAVQAIEKEYRQRQLALHR